MTTADFPIYLYRTNVRSVKTLDLCRGDDDFRKVYIVDDGKQKIVIKQYSNTFTDRRRIEGWFRLEAAYTSLGIYCPAVVPTRTGENIYTYCENGRDYSVYAEEFASYDTAEQFGRDKLSDSNGQPIYLDELMRSIGAVAKERLNVLDQPSQFALFEPYAPPYDFADETTQAATRFAEYATEHFPALRERIHSAMRQFYENQKALQEVYHLLPTSCFQGDLNDSNILVDENGHFAGLIDFNVCGREPILNYTVREAMMHIEDRILFDENGNECYFYNRDLEQLRMKSFYKNMASIAEQYTFSQTERDIFPLLFRYIQPFWWEQVHAIKQTNGDIHKAEAILDWVEYQLTRDDIRLP